MHTCYSFFQELGHEVRDGDLNEAEAARLAIAKMNANQPHDRGWYRINATRMLTGGRKLVPKVLSNFQEVIQSSHLPSLLLDGSFYLDRVNEYLI